MAYVPPHRRRKRVESKTDNQEETILKSAINHAFCINLSNRSERWRSIQTQSKQISSLFIERFEAVNGQQVLESGSLPENDVRLDWDGTKNASYSSSATPGPRTMNAGEVGCALSHIQLWRRLVENEDEPDTTTMLILEDDVLFDQKRGKSRFAAAFCNAWKQLPPGWDILYLGLSARGERVYLDDDKGNDGARPSLDNPQVRLFIPEYGYHTHAYIITKQAAKKLLSCLPVAGPIDVWLADNSWFGLGVFSAVIANEGWRLEDGSYEGKNLVTQDKRRFDSDTKS